MFDFALPAAAPHTAQARSHAVDAGARGGGPASSDRIILSCCCQRLHGCPDCPDGEAPATSAEVNPRRASDIGPIVGKVFRGLLVRGPAASAPSAQSCLDDESRFSAAAAWGWWFVSGRLVTMSGPCPSRFCRPRRLCAPGRRARLRPWIDGSGVRFCSRRRLGRARRVRRWSSLEVSWPPARPDRWWSLARPGP